MGFNSAFKGLMVPKFRVGSARNPLTVSRSLIFHFCCWGRFIRCIFFLILINDDYAVPSEKFGHLKPEGPFSLACQSREVEDPLLLNCHFWNAKYRSNGRLVFSHSSSHSGAVGLLVSQSVS